MYQQGDWVTIKDGDLSGSYARVVAVNLDHTLRILPYDQKKEPGAMQTISESIVKLLPPFELDQKTLRALVRGELLYRDIAEKVFPIFNLKALSDYELQAEDIVDALRSINERANPLQEFREWFWLLNNVLYEHLLIEERYRRDAFSNAPLNKEELFSTVYSLTEDLYWKLEERSVSREDTQKYIVRFDQVENWNDVLLHNTELEETAYKAVCEDIFSRVRTYFYNRERPRQEWIYCASQKRHFINSFESDEALLKAGKAEKALYKKFVMDLYKQKDVQAMRILSWGYFMGESVYKQSFKQAEKYLLSLYQTAGDPHAASALGYIYFHGLGSRGVQYEKAFQYYSYGCLAGLDDCIYSSGEMLIHGQGTVKNVDMGMNLIVDGYRDALLRFNDGEYDNRLSDYALRMGNICMEHIIFGMGPRDAYKFYLEAEFALKKRRSLGKFFGDEELAQQIRTAIARLREDYVPDPDRTVLRADFPLYITQMFEDRFPIRVTIYEEGGEKYLKMGRFRLFPGDESKILMALPELSYVDLVSELKYRLDEVSLIKLPEKGNSFLADGFNKNEHTGALEFYYTGECLAAIEAKWYVMDVTEEKKRRNS